MKTEVKIDTKIWTQLRAKLPADASVQVGVLAAQGGSAGVPGTNLTMSDLAAIHEFGTAAVAAHSDVATRTTHHGHGGIPERSFLRSTFARPDVQARLQGLSARAARAVVSGQMTWQQALGQIGAWAAAQVKGTIRNKLTTGPDPQANAQSTIDRKGSSTPLVDTGRLLGAITWLVKGTP